MTSTDDHPYGDIGTSMLFENERIRVWELVLEPGESSDLHHHDLDYLMVQIEGDNISAHFEPDSTGTFAGSDVLEGPVSPGLAIFAEAGGRETAVNNGSETFREIIVELKGAKPTAPPKLAVQHVSLSVSDLDAALPFYTDALGCEVLPRPDFGIPGAWLAAGSVQIHLVEDPNFEATAGPHVAFETADIDAEVDRLSALGVAMGDVFELNGTKQVFFHDPTGNQLELNQPAAAPGG